MTIRPSVPEAESLMKRDVHTVHLEMTLADVSRTLTEHKISCVPVVCESNDDRRLLVVFVSEQDCLEHLSNEMFHGNPRPPQSAATIMKKHPICVSPWTDICTLSSVFVHHGMRHLPVIDEDNHLLGLVSRREILKALEHFYDEDNNEWQIEHFRPDVHQIVNHRFIVAER